MASKYFSAGMTGHCYKISFKSNIKLCSTECGMGILCRSTERICRKPLRRKPFCLARHLEKAELLKNFRNLISHNVSLIWWTWAKLEVRTFHLKNSWNSAIASNIGGGGGWTANTIVLRSKTLTAFPAHIYIQAEKKIYIYDDTTFRPLK